MRHTKGRWLASRFVLEPWQREFWWEALEVDPATGLRVYTEVGLGLPRKNGKSGVASAGGPLLPRRRRRGRARGLRRRGRPGPGRHRARPGPAHRPSRAHRCAGCCASRRTSSRARATAASCARSRPTPRSSTGSTRAPTSSTSSTPTATAPSTPRSRPARSRASSPSRCGSRPRGRVDSFLGEMYPVMETGPGELEDRGTLRIYRDRVNGILIWWYGAPDDADIEDPAVWRAANPASWLQDGHELGREYARLRARGALTEWRTYHLNQFVATLEGWMPDADWRACAGDVRLRADEPVYACVRVAHDHRTRGRGSRPAPGRARRRARCAPSRAPEGEYVAGRGDRAAPARPPRPLPRAGSSPRSPSAPGGTVRRARPGPEVVCHGAFFEPSRQRLARRGPRDARRALDPRAHRTCRRRAHAARDRGLARPRRRPRDHAPDVRVTAEPCPKGWALASAERRVDRRRRWRRCSRSSGP